MRVVVRTKISNPFYPDRCIETDALVDTGATHLVLPSAWKETLGELKRCRNAIPRLADQSTARAMIAGPVLIKVGDFPEISGEAMFMDMAEPYQALLGHVPLEQMDVMIDPNGTRLISAGMVEVRRMFGVPLHETQNFRP